MSLRELTDEYEEIYAPPVSAAAAEEAEAAIDTVLDALEVHLPRWARARRMIALRGNLRAVLAEGPILQRDYTPFYDKPPFRPR